MGGWERGCGEATSEKCQKARKMGDGGQESTSKRQRPESQCPMHSNGRENRSRFACTCVTKIYCASSSGNWMVKALQLGCWLEMNCEGGEGVAWLMRAVETVTHPESRGQTSEINGPIPTRVETQRGRRLARGQAVPQQSWARALL